MEKTWFYSDPHFGHKNIIHLANRPFSDIYHMDTQLMHRYNSVVGFSSTVYWLGDCFFCGIDRAKYILEQMSGYKILIRGGHDHSVSWMLNAGFDAVVNSAEIRICGRVFILSHYPYADIEHARGYDSRGAENRPVRKKGRLLIHGHTHTRKRLYENCVHVGVDAWDYYPVSADDVSKLFSPLNKP